MAAPARRRTTFAHRRGASSPHRGSHRGRFVSDATNDRLSSARARRGQRACRHDGSSAGPSDAANILQGNVYGWFERIERGRYGLTSCGRAAVVT
jgi:hypothetical protein